MSARRPPAELTTEELARAINNRLRALEADTAWNHYTWTDSKGGEHKQSHFFHAWASAEGQKKVRMMFISYQGTMVVDREQAEDYLTWLRSGERGNFYTANQRGAIRKSREEVEREAAAEATDVAYRHGGSWATPVLRRMYVPDGAETARADQVKDGDRVYVEGRWRKIKATRDYNPPMPEDVQALANEIRDATFTGRYQEAADLAGKLERQATHLAQQRDFEVQLVFAGSKTPVIVLPETPVPIKRAKG